MKKVYLPMLMASLIWFSESVIADPYLYTFSGDISYIEIDGGFYSDVDFDNDYSTTEDSFMVGESIEYVFLVDFDLAGFCKGPLSTSYSDICTGLDIPDSETADYFFASLYSATKLAPLSEEDTVFSYGINFTNSGWLVGDSAIFVVSPYNESVGSWVAKTDEQPGTMVMGSDGWAGPYGNSPYGRINSMLELVSIEPYVEQTFKGKRNKKCMKTKNRGKKKRGHKWKKVCK